MEDRDQAHRSSGNDSLSTVLAAGAANLSIATAKAVAGTISGSAAMLSEAAHSVGDTVNEVLLVVALRRGTRPADPRHPFGFGQESFFWAFLAALATFVLGAGFSITHGIHTIADGKAEGGYTISYIVLAVSCVAEGFSLRQGLRQTRAAADRWSVEPGTYLRLTPDTALKAVVMEDVAALAGLGVAATGLLLEQATGSPVWDGLASVAIGLLLVVVATTLARDNISLLTGEAAPTRLSRRIRELLEEQPGIDQVVELRTMMLGPSEVLVAAAVDFSDDAAGDVEATADAAQQTLSRRFPVVRHVFLDPTPGPSDPAR